MASPQRLKRFRLPLLLCAAVLSPVSAGTARAQVDQVFGAQGTPSRGAITAMGPNEVKLQNSRGEQTFPVNEIKKITYRDDPSKLAQARDAMIGGRFQEALDDLAGLKADDLRSDRVKEDAAYCRAYCLARLALAGNGDVAAAGVELKNYLNQYAGSWRTYQANELFGDLAVAAGKYEAAGPYYQEVAKAPWPEYRLRAVVLEARALMHQGKYAEALPKFESALADESGDAGSTRQKMLAQVGKIQCLAETGQPDQGIQLAEELIANNSSEESELFARVYNALGACHLKAGRTKEALLAYLHTDVLYSGEAEAHAEALYYLGKLWSLVNKSDRAVRSRELLKEKYAGSPWASKP